MVLGAAGAAALCPVLLWHATVLPLGERQGEAVLACWFIVVGVPVFAAIGLLRAARERLILGEDSLTIQGLLRKRIIRWESVTAVLAPRGLYADVPLVLRLRPRQGGLLSPLIGRRVCLAGHWRDHERLVREVAARAGHAAVNRRLRAWLDAPGRVPWPQRIPLLLSLAGSAAVAALALADALAEGVLGLVPGGLVVATAAPCALTAGPIGREWRLKLAFVVAYAVLAVVLALSAAPAVLSGRSDWLLLPVAACLGWAAATLVLCLPWRPRPATAIALYAAALAATLGFAWHCGVRERVPAHALGPLRLADKTLCWSPDGQRLGLHVGEAGTGDDAFAVVERPGLRTWLLPVADLAQRLVLPDPRQALYATCQLRRPTDDALVAARTLWVWDAESGAARRIPVPPHVRLAEDGLVSPDGQRVALLAQDEAGQRWRLHVVSLADLTAACPAPSLDLSGFSKVRWTCDGGLVLTEQHEGRGAQPERLALWTLPPDAGAPERFYETTGLDLWERHSPGGRWALIAHLRGGSRGAWYDLVDLRTRRRRPIAFPSTPQPHHIVWSPDGKALGYAAPAAAGHAVVRLDPLTGELRRVPLTLRGEMLAVALSSEGRFAACVVKGERAARVQVADLATGRLLTLRRPMLFPAPIEPAWSPAGHTLAVAAYDNPLPPTPTVTIRLLDFRAAW